MLSVDFRQVNEGIIDHQDRLHPTYSPIFWRATKLGQSFSRLNPRQHPVIAPQELGRAPVSPSPPRGTSRTPLALSESTSRFTRFFWSAGPNSRFKEAHRRVAGLEGDAPGALGLVAAPGGRGRLTPHGSATKWSRVGNQPTHIRVSTVANRLPCPEPKEKE